jgi:hypothetical protein
MIDLDAKAQMITDRIRAIQAEQQALSAPEEIEAEDEQDLVDELQLQVGAEEYYIEG